MLIKQYLQMRNMKMFQNYLNEEKFQLNNVFGILFRKESFTRIWLFRERSKQ